MLKYILVAMALATSTSSYAAKTQLECVSLLDKKYNTRSTHLYSVRPLIVGRGKYATHFHYEVKYVDLKNKYLKEGCTAKVYCTDYDNEVYVELKYCGK